MWCPWIFLWFWKIRDCSIYERLAMNMTCIIIHMVSFMLRICMPKKFLFWLLRVFKKRWTSCLPPCLCAQTAGWKLCSTAGEGLSRERYYIFGLKRFIFLDHGFFFFLSDMGSFIFLDNGFILFFGHRFFLLFFVIGQGLFRLFFYQTWVHFFIPRIPSSITSHIVKKSKL